MTNEAANGRVLVVDDDQDQRWMVQTYLRKHGYLVEAAEDGAQMRQLVLEQDFDVVLLDVTLPGEDGFSLARYLREHHDVGIIMLTAATELVDRVLGLEIGADDYLTKPFEPRELMARIKSLLRRMADSTQVDGPPHSSKSGAGEESEVIYQFLDYELDTRLYQLRHRGDVCQVEPKIVDLLLYLVRHRDRVISKDELMEHVWDKRIVSESTISTGIKQIRRAIGDDGKSQQLVRTVHSRGFQFVGEVL